MFKIVLKWDGMVVKVSFLCQKSKELKLFEILGLWTEIYHKFRMYHLKGQIAFVWAKI